MILEDATWEAFGYEVYELAPRSHKPILAACELCGEFRIQRKSAYYPFCISCSLKGRKLTEEHKVNIGAGHKGIVFTEERKAKISAAKTGKSFTEEHRANISKNHADFRGKKSQGWRGGKKAAQARRDAKRKELGYALLLPLEEGEVGHHVTNEYVIGIPKRVHEKRAALREKHRAHVLKWLKDNDTKKYEIVLNVLTTEESK